MTNVVQYTKAVLALDVPLPPSKISKLGLLGMIGRERVRQIITNPKNKFNLIKLSERRFPEGLRISYGVTPNDCKRYFKQREELKT